tara:strand:- start:2520 stop:3527 length:1008 start_codon:yes stop_codon:yes gene_type:complete
MLRFRRFSQLVEAAIPYRKLTIPDLRKDENRPKNFIKKVATASPFATVDNGEVIIDVTELQDVTDFMTADDGKFPANKSKMTVNTNRGPLVIPKDFLKTPSFGGKGQGSGTSAEELARADFNDKLAVILAKENLPSIQIEINGRTVDAAHLASTSGKFEGKEPKSDFTLVNVQGDPQAYISHKAGKSAKDYQQYGGLSSKRYKANRDVQSFMKDVAAARPDGLKSGDSFYRKIKDRQLVFEAIYGPEYGGAASISNVDEFHLGNMSLVGSGAGPYKIVSTHKGNNGDFPRGEYEAYFFIRYQARRGDARAAGQVVKNARVGIFPKAKLSRTSKKI